MIRSLPLQDDFKQAYYNNATVNRLFDAGHSLESIVVALVNEQTRLLALVKDLNKLCPFKIQLLNGKVLIWRCPDEWVPFRHDEIDTNRTPTTGGIK